MAFAPSFIKRFTSTAVGIQRGDLAQYLRCLHSSLSLSFPILAEHNVKSLLWYDQGRFPFGPNCLWPLRWVRCCFITTIISKSMLLIPFPSLTVSYQRPQRTSENCALESQDSVTKVHPSTESFQDSCCKVVTSPPVTELEERASTEPSEYFSFAYHNLGKCPVWLAFLSDSPMRTSKRSTLNPSSSPWPTLDPTPMWVSDDLQQLIWHVHTAYYFFL